ncbi:4Fe-4S binding protein [Candidatus Woesearchaeota archaeon]|nr:4Fe-4S binding protein [Candidatus Woesearchaeota archaeon]
MRNLLKEAEKELNGDIITVGLATCGMSAGGLPVYEKLEKAGILPVEKVGCIGMCYAEPIVTVIKNRKKSIYGGINENNVNDLIECIKEDKVMKKNFLCNDISELEFYKKQKRLVMRNSGEINPLKLGHYLYQGGLEGLKKALAMEPAKVVEAIKKSGLRGRGGAGFPTGMKWEFIAKRTGKKYLICNGDEGDPGAFMNRTVMESDPFALIEGMVIAAHATGCDEGIIYTRAEYPLAIKTLEHAIKTCYENNILGEKILGSGLKFDLAIKKGAGAFVCGEETALISSIEGKRGMPRPRPPYPAESGLYERPTNVNNVGTFANVATIMRIGVEEYTKIGTEKTKGTMILCLVGKIKRSGVVEVPMGMKLSEIILDIGGGPPAGKLKAVLSGGPAGGCIPKEHLDIKLDYETLASIGAIMGSGGMVVINDESSMVEVARYFMRFTQEESCGKCTPCREGTKRLLEMLVNVSRGVGKEEDLDKIEALSKFIQENSLCGLGQNAPNPVLSTLKFFRNEYIMHLQGKNPGKTYNDMKQFIITQKCVGCGNCERNCPVKAISGELKKKFKINQDICIKCGKCYDVCAFKAIERK